MIYRLRSLVGLVLLASTAAVAGGSVGVAPPIAARRVVVPLYADNVPTPAATLQIDELRNEFERRGFFRIGLLPLWVAQGVHIDLKDPSRLDLVLSRLARWRPRSVRQYPIEWHDVRLTVPGCIVPILEVGRLRVGPDGRLVLSDGIVLRTQGGAGERRWAAASWSAEGGPCGTLRLPDGTLVPVGLPSDASLLSPNPSPAPKTQSSE